MPRTGRGPRPKPQQATSQAPSRSVRTRPFGICARSQRACPPALWTEPEAIAATCVDGFLFFLFHGPTLCRAPFSRVPRAPSRGLCCPSARLGAAQPRRSAGACGLRLRGALQHSRRWGWPMCWLSRPHGGQWSRELETTTRGACEDASGNSRGTRARVTSYGSAWRGGDASRRDGRYHLQLAVGAFCHRVTCRGDLKPFLFNRLNESLEKARLPSEYPSLHPASRGPLGPGYSTMCRSIRPPMTLWQFFYIACSTSHRFLPA